MTTPRCGLLFHFTHVDNLPAILEAGALLSDSVVCTRELLSNEAGDPEIKDRRRRQPVTCAPGGVVADYVPFYFAARSPMMYKVWKGGVPSFTGDHHDLLYFVSDVGRMVAADVQFAISDRNAAKALADFTNDVTVLGDLTKEAPRSDFVDWPLMRERIWRNTPDDGERMERRMAEFLVHGEVPFDLLAGAAVQSDARKRRVERVFADVECDLKKMTPGRAALVGIMQRYLPFAVEITAVDIQKVMYFMQEAGEPLRLNYSKGLYGPYADNLRHVLGSMEGHYIRGTGDGSAKALDSLPFEVLDEAKPAAAALLAEQPETSARMERVTQLIEGYESTYGLELLATVHWAARRDHSEGRRAGPLTLEQVERVVGSWNRRKKRLFTPQHIAKAYERLQHQGWLDPTEPLGIFAGT